MPPTSGAPQTEVCATRIDNSRTKGRAINSHGIDKGEWQMSSKSVWDYFFSSPGADSNSRQ